MNQGKIIEFLEQGKVVCSLCLQDKGNRLNLLTSLNRQVNLSPKRALLISSSSINFQNKREELLNILKHTDGLRDRLKKEIRINELWELIKDEKEHFGYEYLAQLCFGETVSDDHISALVRALFEDKLYFKLKDGAFLPNSQERIQQILQEREEEALKEGRLIKGGAWLKDVLQDEITQLFPEKQEFIDILIDLALYGKESQNFQFGRELLQRAGVPRIQEAKEILVRLKVWEEDEALDLLRLDIRKSFTEKQLQESDQLAGIEIDDSGREDLRDLDSFTIDGPFTRDFDDALSIDIEGDYIKLGVHITDLTGFIVPGSLLDKEASLRASSLYLARRQIPMIPADLSQGRLSLCQGCDRPAISLVARFDKMGNLLDYRFVPSLINVSKQLTYLQVNEEYLEKNPFQQLHRLCNQLRQRRIERGALILSLPEVSINIDNDSSISIELHSQETPSRMIVAESMILYNWLAARFCRDNDIPILYRSQKEPNEILPIDETGYVYYVFKQRRKLHPLVLDTEPAPHTGLGLDTYTQASSPIRRYLDLVVQRQIRDFLFNEAPAYNKEELDKIRLSVTPRLKDHYMVKRNRIRYWVQKYLMKHLGREFPAIVLDVMKNRYRIVLTDFFLVLEMKRQQTHNLSEGECVRVKINKSDPWNDILSVEYAGLNSAQPLISGDS